VPHSRSGADWSLCRTRWAWCRARAPRSMGAPASKRANDGSEAALRCSVFRKEKSESSATPPPHLLDQDRKRGLPLRLGLRADVQLAAWHLAHRRAAWTVDRGERSGASSASSRADAVLRRYRAVPMRLRVHGGEEQLVVGIRACVAYASSNLSFMSPRRTIALSWYTYSRGPSNPPSLRNGSACLMRGARGVQARRAPPWQHAREGGPACAAAAVDGEAIGRAGAQGWVALACTIGAPRRLDEDAVVIPEEARVRRLAFENLLEHLSRHRK